MSQDSERTVPPSATERMLIARSYGLTVKELELLEMYADGSKTSEACEELGIKPATAIVKMKLIRLKLQARTTVQAVAIGVRNHFLK